MTGWNTSTMLLWWVSNSCCGKTDAWTYDKIFRNFFDMCIYILYIYIYIHFDLNTSLSATNSMLFFHMAPKNILPVLPVLWKSFSLPGARCRATTSSVYIFLFRSQGFAEPGHTWRIGSRCLWSLTQWHRDTFHSTLGRRWEDEKGEELKSGFGFCFCGGDICRLIIVLHTAYTVYTYAGQAHLAIFIEQMLIETDCCHCISSNIYWADMFWHWARLFLRIVLWQTETSIWFQ